MKVCFLINGLGPAGAETLLLDIIRHTDDEDITYTVCFLEGEDALVPDLKAAGARVVDFDAAFKFDPRAIWRLARFFQREEFDILHAHLPYSQTLGRIFGRLGSQMTVVSTQHNVPNERHPITRTLEKLTRPLDTATIAVAEDIQRAFTGNAYRYEGHLSGQWCTIYNGISVEKHNECVRDANLVDFRSRKRIGDGPVFLTIGRYVPAKAQSDLIAAMERLIDDQPSARLFIVGWGKLENELREIVEENGLSENVKVTGRVSNEDIYKYYSLADVFVSSSIREGLPIAILEAMAAELPVVATNIFGVREVVENDETGILTPPNSPYRLADAMKQALMTNEPLGECGYNRVLDRFDINQTTDLHIELYHELLNRQQ